MFLDQSLEQSTDETNEDIRRLEDDESENKNPLLLASNLNTSESERITSSTNKEIRSSGSSRYFSPVVRCMGKF